MNNKELLERVKREDISENELSKIWNNSRSIKIRKQIAKNPNASAEVLEQAARLYLEEVIENPAFEMLALFDSDKWVNTVAKAYQAPGEVLYSSMKWIRQSTSHDILFRAALLSDKLDTNCLDIICTGISATSLSRSLKNQKTKNKIKNLALSTSLEQGQLSLESCLRLYKEKVFDRLELITIINFHLELTASCSKSVYKKFFLKEIESYVDSTSSHEKESIEILLGSLIAKSRSHCFSWIAREIHYSSFSTSDKIVPLFCSIYAFLKKATAASSILNSLLRENIQQVKNVINSAFRINFSACSSKEIEEKVNLIKKMYDTCVFYNVRNLSMARYGIKFISNEWMEAFEKCSTDEQTFFVKEGCIGNWFTVNFSDKKFRIVDQLNEILYKSHGVNDQLIYNSCSIKKIVSLPDTHIF